MTTLEEKIEIMQAALEGKSIEFSEYPDEWVKIYTLQNHEIGWDWTTRDYRVAKKKSSINWDHVQPDYKWMATDSTGKTYLYTHRPNISDEHGYWHLDGNVWTDKCQNVKAFSSFVKGDVGWKDSLVKRP